MGGMLIAAVGYEISTASLNDYLYSNDMFEYTDSPIYRTPDYQKLLNHLESLTSTAVYLIYLDDNCNLENTTIRHTYLCCYADYRDRVYDCEEIMKIEIPNGFERIREVLETDGAGVKRVFGGKGHGVYRSGD